MINIQSISDIITNSSSEVFVITTDKHAEVAKFIKDVCEVFGVDMDEIMEFESSTTNHKDSYTGVKVAKGDLVIYSAEENSIPAIIMDMIESLDWANYLPNVKPLNIKRVHREHIG